MNKMPLPLRKELSSDPYYTVCARKNRQDHICDGRITYHHAVRFAGKNIQKPWAIVPLCAKAHSVDDWQDRGDFSEEISHWIAYGQATDEELLEVSKAFSHLREKSRLNGIYGTYTKVIPKVEESIIHQKKSLLSPFSSQWGDASSSDLALI